MSDPLQVLYVGQHPPDLATSPWGPFVVDVRARLADVEGALRTQSFDAMVVAQDKPDALDELAAWPALSHAVLDAALVVVAPEPAAAAALRLLRLGVQDLLSQHDAAPQVVARVLRLAVERKRIERAARRTFATDLATGLPNHAQLREHLTHLLALREREPAPMALIALRIEGLAATEAALGVEAANVLRRKVAVRLRAALRASDVVAAVGGDAFAVLLAWTDAEDDGERVAAKLAASLRRPFGVAGRAQGLGVAVGLALVPAHGREADALLRRAIAQAASSATRGATPLVRPADRGPDAAANDEV